VRRSPEPELTTAVRGVAAEFARGAQIIELQIDEVSPTHERLQDLIGVTAA
jgi:hypothetical protein